MVFHKGIFVRDNETVFKITNEIKGMNVTKAEWPDPPAFQDNEIFSACEIFKIGGRLTPLKDHSPSN